MKKSTLKFLLWFFFIWLGVNLIFPKGEEQQVAEFMFATDHATYSQGDKVSVIIENNFPYDLRYTDDCPGEPFVVTRNTAGTIETLTAQATGVTCAGGSIIIPAAGTTTIDFGPWNKALFWDMGDYTIQGTFARTDVTAPTTDIAGPAPADATRTYTYTTQFSVGERGMFSTVIQKLFYQPIYNFLIFLTSVTPSHNLGIAIIALTIAIRALLFVPTLHSLKSQQALQQLQPKIQEIREKYKGDQQKLAQETMRLYKENGVNPFGSCLPILVQLPFLFAVFYVLQTGLDPSNTYLLYGPLVDFDLASISHHFLTFDTTLAEPVIDPACGTGWQCFNFKSLVFPVIVAGLQWVSSWLMVRRTKQTPLTTTKTPEAEMQQKTMNIMTLYFIPLMVGWFAIMYPVGLSLYWATTTLFSVGQQTYLARARDKAVAKQEGR